MQESFHTEEGIFFEEETNGEQEYEELHTSKLGDLESILANRWSNISKREEYLWDLVEREGLFTKNEIENYSNDIKVYDDSLTEEEKVFFLSRLTSAVTKKIQLEWTVIKA